MSVLFAILFSLGLAGACPTDDGWPHRAHIMCEYDAELRGNGGGTSFYSLRARPATDTDDGLVIVHYN